MKGPVSADDTNHYAWGEICDGWHLLQRDDLSVIQERVPPGGTEVMHYHQTARQFFFILEGQGTMVFGDQHVSLKAKQGLEIPPAVPHQFRNDTEDDVHFLVISMPASHGDRIEV